MILRHASLPVIATVAALFASAPLAIAQQQGAPAPNNALQGFSQNRDKPVHIKAQSFELRDKDRKATFTGNVHVTQGDTVIRCKSLVVTYEPNATTGNAKNANAAGGPGGNSQISKLEAMGGVIVTQKEQTATGDMGLFDVRANTVTLIGNVVVSQGGSTMRGERLVVDLTTGVSRVESARSRSGQSGQVEMMIQQSGPSASKSGNPLQQMRPDSLRTAPQN